MVRKLQGAPPHCPPQCCGRCQDPVGWDLGLAWQGDLGTHRNAVWGHVWNLPGRRRREGHPPALGAPPTPGPQRSGLLLSGLQQLANPSPPTPPADLLGERTPFFHTRESQEPAPC